MMNPKSRVCCAGRLPRKGYEVQVAADGEEALKCIPELDSGSGDHGFVDAGNGRSGIVPPHP